MPTNSLQSELAKFIKNQFPYIKIIPMDRKNFSETSGSIFLKDLTTRDDLNDLDLLVSDKYLCLASASALTHYIQTQNDMSLLKNSLKIDYRGCESSIVMDLMTIQSLDLIPIHHRTSLLDVIDFTKTVQGARLIRTNILQPPNDKATIELRQSCVKEIMERENLRYGISKALSAFSDMDGYIRQIVQQPIESKSSKVSKKTHIKHSQVMIQNFLNLKKNLDAIPFLVNVLDGSQNDLLKTISSNLTVEGIRRLNEEISSNIDVVVYDGNKSKALVTLNQLHYAIKPGIHGSLDTARNVYTERMEEMNQLVQSYKLEYESVMQDLKLQYNTKREFYLSALFKNEVQALPSIFYHEERKGKRRHFTSDKLIALNQRIRSLSSEILSYTQKHILSLQMITIPYLPFIYKLSESVALLDMLHSFATYAIESKQETCNPEISKEGPIAISNGYHPILTDVKKGLGRVIPNNTYATDTLQNVHIITGENNSGKTTYLTQIALLTILAHMGVPIPAQFASIRLVDRIFTRIGSQDSIEMNASSFLMEMKSVSYIMNNATSKSLVLIDELGRSTSYYDAVPICWSICEHLMSLKSFLFLSTHFVEMAKSLQELYPTVKVHKFLTELNGETLKFQFSLREGCLGDNEYGIQLAQQNGWPWDIMLEARRIRAMLDENIKKKKLKAMNSVAFKASEIQRTKRIIVDKIRVLKNSALDEEGKMSYLKEVKVKFQKILEEL